MPNNCRINGKLRAHLMSLFTHSTVHGISHAASAPSKLEKAFWLGLVLAGLTTFVVNVTLVTDRYLDYPVLTVHHPGRDPFTWPDVTFCDSAPVLLDDDAIYRAYQRAINELSNDSFVQNLTGLMDSFLQGERDAGDKSQMDETLNTLTRSIALSTMNSSMLAAVRPSSILATTSYKLHNDFIRSEINIDSNWRFLNESDIQDLFHVTTVVMRFRCACYTLRLRKLVQRDQFRSVDSMQFVIRGNYLTYARFNSSNYQFGGRVYIHRPGTLPEDGRLIESPPGVTTTVFLTQRRQQLLREKSNCRREVMSVPVYDFLMAEARHYNLSHEYCHQVLSQTLFYQHCGCYNPHLIIPKLDDKQPLLCFNVTAFSKAGLARNLRCLSDTARLYRNVSTFGPLLRSRCSNLRRPECDSVTWVTDSQRELYREMWAETANPARINFIREAIRSVNQNLTSIPDEPTAMLRLAKLEVSNFILIAAGDRGDVITEESEYPVSQFLSDIGGLMGLYLGVSVIGLCELFEVIVLLLKTFCQDLHCRVTGGSGSATTATATATATAAADGAAAPLRLVRQRQRLRRQRRLCRAPSSEEETFRSPKLAALAPAYV